jgi:hypothetical protein
MHYSPLCITLVLLWSKSICSAMLSIYNSGKSRVADSTHENRAFIPWFMNGMI